MSIIVYVFFCDLLSNSFQILEFVGFSSSTCASMALYTIRQDADEF